MAGPREDALGWSRHARGAGGPIDPALDASPGRFAVRIVNEGGLRGVAVVAGRTSGHP